jgi:hypothetical protein
MLPRMPTAETLPTKPLALRALNAAGGALQRAGIRLPRLDPETLCRAAAQKTGLSDFGDSPWREGLERLVEAFEREAKLTTFGRVIARIDLLRLLQNRLHMEATLRANPEIERGPVRAPIFVIGQPRTGTTILHELLALDPALRAPTTWETMFPWPPPEAASFDTDPRIAQVDAHLAGTERVMPGFQSIHRMGARLPQECVALSSHEFASILFTTTHKVDAYQRWVESIDHRRIYRAHRRWLQYLQWKAPATCWALKSPAHVWTLDALLDVYPDARIVQTHRDPLRVLASLASLCTLLRSMASDAIDPRAIAAEWAPRLAEGLDASMRVRDAARLGDDRIYDLHFHRFLGNEIATLHEIYERFGMQLSPEAETRMRRYLAAHPKGGHQYQLGDAGLDTAAERRRYAAYVERYAIPAE